MPLADNIQKLKERVLRELIEEYDYYENTQSAWEIVELAIQNGYTQSIQSKVTGTITTESDLLNKSNDYIKKQLTQATFQQFISIFENFFLDFLRLWLKAYPRSLASKKIDFQVVLDAPDKDGVADYVVGKELNEILYERPSSWFTYLEEKAKLGCPSPSEIEQVAEAKASRDILVHNQGVVNRVYVIKSGALARFKDGEYLDLPEKYHRGVWELLQKIVADVSGSAIAKLR